MLVWGGSRLSRCPSQHGRAIQSDVGCLERDYDGQRASGQAVFHRGVDRYAHGGVGRVRCRGGTTERWGSLRPCCELLDANLAWECACPPLRSHGHLDGQ